MKGFSLRKKHHMMFLIAILTTFTMYIIFHLWLTVSQFEIDELDLTTESHHSNDPQLKLVNDILKSLKIDPYPNKEDALTFYDYILTSKTKDKSPVSEFVKTYNYSEYYLQGFTGASETFDMETISYGDKACANFNYAPLTENQLHVSKYIPLNDDFRQIVKELKASIFAPLLLRGRDKRDEDDNVDSKDKKTTNGGEDKDIDNLVNKLARFGGSSAWLPDVRAHLVASRILYAPAGRDSPISSFTRLQLFDSEFNEIKGRRVKYSDISYTEMYDFFQSLGGDFVISDQLLDQISIKLPCILEIPNYSEEFENLLGPEDPRLALMPSNNDTVEPIIVYNIRTTNGRIMQSVYPLRKPFDQENRFKVTNFSIRGQEGPMKTQKKLDSVF